MWIEDAPVWDPRVEKKLARSLELGRAVPLIQALSARFGYAESLGFEISVDMKDSWLWVKAGYRDACDAYSWEM